MSNLVLHNPQNLMTFPRALREAIPDQELCFGRCLKLDSADARGGADFLNRRGVELVLRACETGKLDGVFEILVALDVAAARALADVINRAADQAEGIRTAGNQ